MPLYLIKINVFNIPTNILELLALSSIILVVVNDKKLFLKKILELPMIFIFSCFLIVFGLLLSIFFNNNHLVGLGILKGWFILPILFSFMLYLKLDLTLNIEKIYKSIFYSTTAVSIIAIFYKLFEITTYDSRLSAFYLSPNHLAMYITPGVFFGLYFMLISILQKHSFKKIFLHAMLLIILLISLYYTYSYAAWLALLGSLIIVSLTVKPFKKIILAIILFIFICGLLLFVSQKNSPKMISLLDLSSRSSLTSRETIWKVSIQLIKNNPFIGIGPGNFQSSYLAMQKYYPPYLEWAIPQPHNVFLAFWLQAGLLGLIGFLLLLYFIFTTLWQLLRNKKSAALAAPLFGFFLYTILHGLIDTPFWKNDLAFLFWICIFLTTYLNKQHYKA
ncbi:MAG: hypothetical protein US25_C0019G0010 [Candidatus Moranbacteria bacterium GW2011_GWE1_36_7]|nr:MAG: hypothetical protein UR99_C0015G0023 [Candidatus Moranbacteria bacterium GW2011_GWD2_36_12]KKQ06388.1 MAG: hypothetical protein US16_C0018G0022 [Candidatus Moranbacteria bacterium GW2011_GWE2_36_40]KKQ14828.1 MAG: hypothetical protein US25_C0019G0010 [Candidatus Moranbacteria bacterium GW2011_GWE1_36_7]